MFNIKFKKMKNLEIYGVQKMGSKEIRETDGGQEGEGSPWLFGWILGRISKYNGNSTHIWGN